MNEEPKEDYRQALNKVNFPDFLPDFRVTNREKLILGKLKGNKYFAATYLIILKQIKESGSFKISAIELGKTLLIGRSYAYQLLRDFVDLQILRLIKNERHTIFTLPVVDYNEFVFEIAKAEYIDIAKATVNQYG